MSKESSAKCPQCGAPIKDNAPAGLCPNCLMALNLKTETVLTDNASAEQPPLPPEQIASRFPQLEILECLGRGGMGVVYQARQKTLNRVIALKLLAPERVDDPKFAERFACEAQALAALNHPNIVTVYDFGQTGGYYFLLMELVDGANLRQLLRARKFTPEEALAIVPPLCEALQFAHERGIVHRDIKPENILLDKAGRVKIADFGIAKMLGADDGGFGEGASRKRATQSAIGTPGYSAPEQKSDPQRVDTRADIYSLGVVFYEMLTGELPGKPIEPPSSKVQVDVRLDQVVLRALERTPELRWQMAVDLRTQVETIAAASSFGGSGRGETRSAVAPHSRRWHARQVVARGFIAAFIVFLLVFVGMAVVKNLKFTASPEKKVMANQSHLATKSVSFGPVIQRTLYDEDGNRTNASMIDLDTGKVFSASALAPERSEQPFIAAVEAGLKRMRREQIDLLGDTSGKSFVGFEMIVVPAEQPFDLLTAEGVAADKRLAGSAETQVDVTVQEVPATFLFKTREGGRGVLQVARFSTNLESMDFRYKLVRPRREFVRNSQGKEPTAQEIRIASVEEWFNRIGKESEFGYVPFTVSNALIRKSKQSSEIKEEIIRKAIATIEDPLENDFKRWQCCYLLSGIGDKRSIPAIARVLKDESEIVRSVAACALGEFDDSDVRPTLEAAARSERSSRVLEEIHKALKGDYRRRK